MKKERPENIPKLEEYTPSKFMLPTSHYDENKADRAVKFIESLSHTKGKWAGKPFWLFPWQEKIIRDIFGIVNEDGKRQFRTAFVEIPKKNGKQLSLDTPIPTPNGFTAMEELKVGDTVFDENGLPCRVVAKSEVDDTEQAYKLTFRDGSSIIAGARHLWDCECIHGKRRQVEWTTEEIYRRTEAYKRRFSYSPEYEKRSLIRIPVCKPLQTKETVLPIDPYLYGYWLGNGSATKPEITIRNCDVENVIANIPYKLHNRYPQKCGGSEIVVYKELKKILVSSFREKAIRPEYLRASEAQRWKLLQGLMDSDGSVSRYKGQSIYCSTIKKLALTVSELLWSLGIKNAMKTEPSRRYGIPTGETLYIIRFTTFEDQPTSGLLRKAERKRERKKDTRSNYHYLKDIQPVAHPVKMQCIQVDSPSHQYLAGTSMIPTHNSELAAAVALYMLYADGEPSAEVYGAAADRQQASIVFDVAKQMVEMTPALLKRSKIMGATKRIVNYQNSGYYQVLSAEVGCVSEDTIVQLSDGRLKTAKEVIPGDTILSFDGRMPVFDEVVSVREEEPSPMVKIITNHGREIEATVNHPFYKMRPGRRMQDLTHAYEWEEAAYLAVNDHIAVGLGWPEICDFDESITPLEARTLGTWAGDNEGTVIPESVLRGGKEIWAAFLAGYIDTDDCAIDPAQGDRVKICSVSSKMLTQLQVLCARLGINASVCKELNLIISGRLQLKKLWSFLSPYMVHPKKRESIERFASKDIKRLQRANESDKVKEIQIIGEKKSISFEMRRYQTHSTNGLITHNTKHGLNVSGLVLDELHSQPNRHLFDVLTKGSGDAREQPLYFLITTAGTDRESICYEMHQKAKDILSGRKIDPTFYPVVYGLADDEDWRDEANWYKVNPSLGQTISIDRVRDMYRDALDNPAEENVFKQLRLNMWVSSLTRFIPEHIFDLGNEPINTDALIGRDCYGGLDLSSTGDITALVLIFPPRDETERYVLLPFFWIPKDTIPIRVRRASVPYDVWEKKGFLIATEGNVIHYGFIEKFINDLNEKYHICEIAVDRWNATMLTQNLADDGFTMIPFGQGYSSMSPPTKEFYKLLMEGKIQHGGNPILSWMAGNVVVDTDPAGNIKCTKAKSSEKIDGIVAAIMALDRCVRHEKESGSVYDDPNRGLLSF